MKKIVFLNIVPILICVIIPTSFSLALVSGTHLLTDITDPDCSFYGNFPGDSSMNSIIFFRLDGSFIWIFGCQQLQKDSPSEVVLTWGEHPILQFSGDSFTMNVIETTSADSSHCVNSYAECLPYAIAANQLTLVKPVKAVSLDIKPNDSSNTINLDSNGTVSVVIFSTPSFDARTIDPLTVTLASAPIQLRGNGTGMYSFQDVNTDGLSDLVVHVNTEVLQLSSTAEVADLAGYTYDNFKIVGSDLVRVLE